MTFAAQNPLGASAIAVFTADLGKRSFIHSTNVSHGIASVVGGTLDTGDSTIYKTENILYSSIHLILTQSA